MKSALQLVKQALAGPLATTATSRMCKIQDSRIWAYGGTFCLSTPVQSPLECAFKPAAVEKFFALDRKEFTMTRHDSTLILKCGTAEDRVPVILADEVPTLQAIGQRWEITEQPVHLKEIAALSNNNKDDWTQFAWLINGMLFALHNRSICLSVNAFHADIPKTGIPSASIQALASIKSPLVAVVRDQQSIQFEFKDGTWLASRYAEMETHDFLNHFEDFDDPDVFKMIALEEGVAEEILARELYGEKDGIKYDMIWHGQEGMLQYVDFDNNTGIIDPAYTGADEPFRIKGVSLRTILDLEPDTLGFVHRNQGPSSLNALGDGYAISAALSRMT